MTIEQLRQNLGEIGLGTFPFSNVFSPVSQDSAYAVVAAFVDLGGKYLETAPSYPERGVSLRSIIRKFSRSELVLASKCVTSVESDGTRKRTGKADAIRQQCMRELDRLGTDYLDVLQAHITPEDVDPSETMQALSALRSEGLVRFVGVSNVSLEQLKQFALGGSIDLVQNRFSVIHRSAYLQIKDYCQKENIFINPFQVIERGQLTGSTLPPDARREGDMRSSKAEYKGEAYEVIRSWFDSSFSAIAREAGYQPETLAIAWVLNQPQIAICVIGATSTEQIARNLTAVMVKLNPTVLGLINASYSRLCSSIHDKYGLSIEEFRGLLV